MAINKSFKDYGLSEEIVRALRGLIYNIPTDVQAKVIPIALEKEDLIVKSQTGRRIKAVAVYGKQSFVKQKLELKQKAHVVVGTPGRVLDHIEKGTLVVEQLNFLIIDEADEMLNMGFIDQVEAIIKELPTEQ